MIEVQSSPEENARLKALRRYDSLGAPLPLELDDLLRLATLISGLPTAVLSVIDVERQWFVARALPDSRGPPESLVFQPCGTVGPDSLPLAMGAADSPAAGLVIAGPSFSLGAALPQVATGGHVLGTLRGARNAAPVLTVEVKEALGILCRQAGTHFRLHSTAAQAEKVRLLHDLLTQMIVHDLRQPLQSLLGGLHTLRFLGEINAEQDELLRISVDGGEALLEMINDLLDISKLESGSLELSFAPLAPAVLVNAAVARLAQLAAAAEVALVCSVEPGLPSVSGDEDKLGRTLVNLLGNAVKFTPRGGTVTVSARTGFVPGSVRFSVADTGEGIPADALELIFEKFGQVVTRKGGRKMSTGLGLTFCRMVVEAHGGRLRVASPPGAGATFEFSLA